MGAFDDVKLGVCDIFYRNPGQSSFTNFGLTSGGCEFSYTPKWQELTADQYGTTPIDYVLVGEGVSVKIPLIQTSKEKLKMAMPGATLDATKKVLSMGSRPGKRASNLATCIVLHPISSGSSHEDDVAIFMAFNNGEAKLPYTVDKEQVIESNFIGLIDPSRPDGSMLCSIGENLLGNTATTVVKLALESEIATANNLLTIHLVGTADNNVTQAVHDALTNVVNASIAVDVNASATQAQVDAQVTALTTAVTTFNSAII